MNGWSKLAAFVAVAAIVAGLSGGAGATNAPTRAASATSKGVARSTASTAAARRSALLRHANLTTVAGAKRYLRAIGVDPRGVVIQRGARNYAGPSCPGARWTCTSTAHPVVQLATAGGKNTFLCTSGRCAVMQGTIRAAGRNARSLAVATTTNTARCVKTTGVTQSCSINQASATANNEAIVYESTGKMTGLSQTASFTASIVQNATGDQSVANYNRACVYQAVNIDGSTTGKNRNAATVTLNATQSVSITQNSAFGGNSVQNAALSGTIANCAGGALTQTQTLSSTVTGLGPITQNENAGATDANVSLDIEQNQGAESAFGANAAPFSQTSTLTALASTPAGPVNQTQGSANGGILAKVNQFSHDISTANATQTETQCERAQASGTPTCTTSNKPTYVLHQVQFGPISNSGGSRSAASRKLAYVKKGACPPACSTQGDNSADTFSINQSSTQNNDTHTDQTNTVQGECQTSGSCTATQTTNENGTTTTHTASGSSVDTSTDCTDGSCTTTTSKGFVSGDLFVSVGNGLVQERSPSGALVRTLDTGMGGYTTGLAFDAGPRLYVTDFGANAVTRFLSDGTASSFGSGYNAAPESIVFDSSGNAYVGQASGSKQVLKFSPSGTLLASFSPAPEVVGTDWIELAPDQCTLYYTSEGSSVKRFNVCTSTQLSDFASGLHHGFEIRLRPGGGALVADFDRIVRLDASGNIAQTYGDGGTLWFSLALDPSGTSFWAGDADTGDVKKFDIASGTVLASFNTGSTVFEGAADGIAIAP
jgi:sugar lactone lactonase YvrE